MNNCGYCKHYVPGKAFCLSLRTPVGFLDVKPCYEATTQITDMEENNKEQTKICKRCGRELPVHEFGRHARTADGLQVFCRQCSKEAMMRTRKKKVEKAQEKVKSGLSAFDTDDIINELRRRGLSGYLKQVIEISV